MLVRMTSMVNGRTAKAIGFELAQHGRNHLALGLVVFFIPAWITLVKALLPTEPISYHSDVVGGVLEVPSNQLATISGAINAVTLIVGFMMFSTVRRSGDFDQRLVLAGYSRVCLLLAKSTALTFTSGLVALYATFVMTVHWDPRQPWLLALGLFVSALTYGGMGVVLGLVLPTELAGMFMIIMISLVDVIVQNPVINPTSNQALVRFMPTYGAMQACAAAAFTDTAAVRFALIGLLWLAAFGSVAAFAFYVRTKDHAKHDPPPDTSMVSPASVTVATNADGTLDVRAVSGNVMLCTHGELCGRPNRTLPARQREPRDGPPVSTGATAFPQTEGPITVDTGSH